VPLALGAVVMLLMYTWRRAAGCCLRSRASWSFRWPIWCRCWKSARRSEFPHRCVSHERSVSAPTALMHSLKHYKVLHEKNVILTSRDRANAADRSGRASEAGTDQRNLLQGNAAVWVYGVS